MKLHWLEMAVADVPADDNWLGAAEQARLSAMRVPKRRSDWRLGRWTAKHAVAACLNLPRHPQGLAGIEIRPAVPGAPEVFLDNQPAAVSISLSHRAGVAACAVAPLGTMLGCDLELIEPRSDGFLADYFTAGEQELVARAAEGDRDRVVNLLWSAKESVLKALCVGLREDCRTAIVRSVEGLLDHDHGGPHQIENPISAWQPAAVPGHLLPSVELQSAAGHSLPIAALQPDAAAWRPSSAAGFQPEAAAWRPLPVAGSRSEAAVWRPLQVAYTGGRIFHGWWLQTGPLLRTIAASPPSKPPVMLTASA